MIALIVYSCVCVAVGVVLGIVGSRLYDRVRFKRLEHGVPKQRGEDVRERRAIIPNWLLDHPAALIVPLFVVVLFFILHGCSAYLDGKATIVRQYFRHVGEGDAAAACALLHKNAQAKIMQVEQVTTCTAAVSKVYSSLTPEQRSELINGDVSVSSSKPIGEDHTELRFYSTNPLDIGRFEILKKDGREVIYDWH